MAAPAAPEPFSTSTSTEPSGTSGLLGTVVVGSVVVVVEVVVEVVVVEVGLVGTVVMGDLFFGAVLGSVVLASGVAAVVLVGFAAPKVATVRVEVASVDGRGG